VGSYMTLGTLFDQNWSSSPEGCYISNSNALQPVANEMMKRREFFRSLLGPKMDKILHLNKSESPSPKDVSYQFWLNVARWFLRQNRLKETLAPNGRTTDAATWHKHSWPSARWVTMKQILKEIGRGFCIVSLHTESRYNQSCYK